MLQEITRDIIGAAMAVSNELEPGLDEKLCENALEQLGKQKGGPGDPRAARIHGQHLMLLFRRGFVNPFFATTHV